MGGVGVNFSTEGGVGGGTAGWGDGRVWDFTGEDEGSIICTLSSNDILRLDLCGTDEFFFGVEEPMAGLGEVGSLFTGHTGGRPVVLYGDSWTKLRCAAVGLDTGEA